MIDIRIKTGLVKETGNIFNIKAIQGWKKALDLWRIPYEILDIASSNLDEISCYSVIVCENLGKNDEKVYERLDNFLRNQGSLIFCGFLGCIEKPRVPLLFKRLTGIKDICARSDKNKFRSILVTRRHPVVKTWRPGDTLFFTNSYYSSSFKGIDFEICSFTRPKPRTLAGSAFSEIVSTNPDVWGKWEMSDEPSIIENRRYGGTVLYVPISLGLIDKVMQPIGGDINNYGFNQDHVNCEVENYGILLLMKNLIEYTVEKAEGILFTLNLWPSGANTVVCLTGDVHEYESYPPGHLRREYLYISKMINLLEKMKLKGKYTFCVSGKVAKNHPEEVKKLSDWDVVPHTFDDVDYVSLRYNVEEQEADIIACIKEFEKVLPEKSSYRVGWRTHNFGSDYNTRKILEKLSFLWIGDMGMSWKGEWDFKNFSQPIITYASLPQRSKNLDGREMKLWELPEAAPNDVAVYRHSKYSPQEAFKIWRDLFDRARMQGTMFMVLWHPYVSLGENDVEERAKTIKKLIEHFKSKKDCIFMDATSLAFWWDSRHHINLVIDQDMKTMERKIIRLKLLNSGNRKVRGVTVSISFPSRLMIDKVKILNKVQTNSIILKKLNKKKTLIFSDLDPNSILALEIGFRIITNNR